MELTSCDREPIHIPGSIQAHGALLVVCAATLGVKAGAGDLEGLFGDDWLDKPLSELLGTKVASQLGGCRERRCHIGWLESLGSDAVAFALDAYWLVQLEPSPGSSPAADVLGWMDEVGLQFERAANLLDLCERAARCFSELTGYDRVMIYRFLDDDAGEVIAECNAPGMSGFKNHRFPGADIPRQARELYVRNRVRVIPDVSYEPQPLRPQDFADIDLSDVELRSVSPVHIQYLKNMGVAASASMSIVRDGVLWGLVACHHNSPRHLNLTQRRSAQLVAAGLARQIGAKEEAENYRERIRLRTAEDALYSQFALEGDLFAMMSKASATMSDIFLADGFAIVHGGRLHVEGHCPDREDIKELSEWLRLKAGPPFYTDELGKLFEPSKTYAAVAAGVLAVTLSTRIPTVLIWFRAEELQHIEWAGNPHQSKMLEGETLTPRASFEAWSDIVTGKSRPWTSAQTEGAHRLVTKLFEIRQSMRLKELAGSLQVAVADKDRLLEQKDTLLKEVNHRVQNSLQLVMAFLSMQARASKNIEVTDSLAEAQRRLAAVALVHRRLYADDNVEHVDLSRYLEELILDLKTSMGASWQEHLVMDLAPVMMPADGAINVGLILVELVINAQKYAYAGEPGPITIVLEQHRARFRLIVADRGKGRSGTRQGFGSRMVSAMVKRLQGTLEDDDNLPGLRVILTAPIDPQGRITNSMAGSSEMPPDEIIL